jgi:hypothetical protein
MYGHEPDPRDPETITVQRLLHPDEGFIIPADHPLADTPGGVRFAQDYVLFGWA